MSLAATLLDIVRGSPGGVLIYCPDVNGICREIFAETGVMLRPERQVDHYESDKLDYFGDPYIKTRINRRKFKIKL